MTCCRKIFGISIRATSHVAVWRGHETSGRHTVTRWIYECLQDRRLRGQVITNVGGVLAEEDVWHLGQLKFMVHNAYSAKHQKERYPESSSVFSRSSKS